MSKRYALLTSTVIASLAAALLLLIGLNGMPAHADPDPTAQEVLLTEIVVSPAGGEFIEIHNPSGATVPLSDVYLTDATFSPGDVFYYNIVTGDLGAAGGGGFGDFHARFPTGATIGPGEYQTIALAGSDDFVATYGVTPTYELYEDGDSADSVPDMQEALPGSINDQGNLSNDGEVVILYYWNGVSDLVTDLDYAPWGDKAEAVDKTGVTIDSASDTDSTPSTYRDETSISDQHVLGDGTQPHDAENSIQRLDLAEGAEATSDGNGVDGEDETSEDLGNTWCEGAPSPNAGTACPPALTKSAPGLVNTGDRFTYTLTVENRFATPLNDVAITDVVPTNATFAGSPSGVYNGSVVSWTIPSVAASSSVSVTFSVTASNSLTNTTNAVYTMTASNYTTPTTGAPVTTIVFAPGAPAIHDIQGAAHISPMEGEEVVAVRGIVTALDSGSSYNGFYMQDDAPDGDPATSEGVFVYTESLPDVEVGDEVFVSGDVTEFRAVGFHADFSVGPGADDNLTITRIATPTVFISSTGNTLPAATTIGQGGRMPPTSIIDNDSTGDVETSSVFDPAQDGIDFYESLEGMLVRVNNAAVVGATRSFGDVVVLPDNGANTTGNRTENGGILAEPGDFHPERVILTDDINDTPLAYVGDKFTKPITGVIDYSFGNFKLQPLRDLTRAGDIAPGGYVAQTSPLQGAPDKLTVASFNVENLNPNEDRFDDLADIVVNNLNSPDILAVQEIQDDSGRTDDGTVEATETYTTLVDAIATAGGPTYDFRDVAPEDNQDGGAPGGNIRVGFLFNPDRVTFVDRGNATPTDSVTVTHSISGASLSLSPGRIDPTNPAFDDSRKSLAAEFIFNGRKVFVINNHLKSKSQDDPLFGRYQPPTLHTEDQRDAQAQVINDFVDVILDVDPLANVIVLGDLNEFQFREPIQDTLAGDVLINLLSEEDAGEQYTYVFDGNSQVLDHILVSDNVNKVNPEFDIVHVNADRPETLQASDHEPLLMRFAPAPRYTRLLPIIFKD